MKKYLLTIVAVYANLTMFCSGKVDDNTTINDSTIDASTEETVVYPDYIKIATDALDEAYKQVPDYTLAAGTVCSNASTTTLECSPGSACASTANCGIQSAYISLVAYSTQSSAELCTHIKEYKKNLEAIGTSSVPMAPATAENCQRVENTYVQLRIASVNIDTYISAYCQN